MHSNLTLSRKPPGSAHRCKQKFWWAVDPPSCIHRKQNTLQRCRVSQELVRERGELEAKLARDYGAGDAFLPLEGRCFTASVDKYQYEVCPYGAAQQKDGGMSTGCGLVLCSPQPPSNLLHSPSFLQALMVREQI